MTGVKRIQLLAEAVGNEEEARFVKMLLIINGG
jgi:hypothetical protein